MLSRSNVPSEEWMLHPQVVQKIWKTFGKAEVDLFASKDNSHCPTYYSKDRDALAQYGTLDPSCGLDIWPLHLAAQWEPTGFPERVLNTISEARAPSTRRFYALKWSVFSTWCLNRGENPSTSELAVVLSFLQELLDKGRSHSTLKVFVHAAFHAPIAGQSVGRDNSVVHF